MHPLRRVGTATAAATLTVATRTFTGSTEKMPTRKTTLQPPRRPRASPPLSSLAAPHLRRGSAAAPVAAAADASANAPAEAPPLLLDPPYTPVRGEAEAAAEAAGGRLQYVCAGCGAEVFDAADLAPGSGAGAHASGWPTFLSPSAPDALVTRSVRQRTAVRGTAGGGALAGLTPAVAMTYRGLEVEGDLVRGGGAAGSGGVRPLFSSAPSVVRGLGSKGGGDSARGGGRLSWRARCLRDPQQRSDPSLLEGCCRRCRLPVCRVVTHKGVVHYVSTASAIEGRRTEE